jgi:3'(2'), 5'-bisphosphate nucleotidase
MEVMSVELLDLVEPVRAIACEAGQRIMDIYAAGFTVTAKADETPLTEADLAAHDCIVEKLRRLDASIPILSEEDCAINFSERRTWEWLWLVDPLDGTKEFIKRSDQFSVNIALIHRHEAVFGVILIPTSGVCYFACRGGGAFKQKPEELSAQPIHTRPVGHRPIRVAGGRSYVGRPLRTYLEYMGRHQYMKVGSSLKSCLVAEGEVDLYPRFGPTSEWDTAAAQIIVEEAGGQLTDFFMRPLRYNARPTLLNPEFFAFGDPSKDWSQYLPRRKPRI